MISAHNESDVIAQVVGDLIDQGIQVYLIDDGSSDDTLAAVDRWLNKGLIAIERRPPSPFFGWTEILRRKEQLAAELDADWFMHQDADELRESPWSDLGLLEAIREVDRLGYNAIEFKVLNFRPTHDAFQPGHDLRTTFPYYEPAEHFDAAQVKCWKKAKTPVDLTSSGGHEAVFADRRLCPVQFLSRHYPIRNTRQGQRKVFAERKPRFGKEELERGWHVQYDHVSTGDSFIRDPLTLREFDSEAVGLELMLAHRDTQKLALTIDELADERQQSSIQRDELAREQQRVLELENRISSLRQTVDSQHIELGRLHREHDLELVAASARQVALEERLRTMEGAQAELQKVQEKVQNELTNSRAETRALYASLSWRLTRPLRALYDSLLGRRGASRDPRERRTSKARL